MQRLSTLALVMHSSRLALIAALAAAPSPAHAIMTIAVDVGHTLAQPGATSARGETEFNFNRTLATTVQEALQSAGFATQPIGEHGMMKALTARTDAAAKADFFFSVHHDSMQPRYLSSWNFEGKTLAYGDGFSGFSLFVSRKNPHWPASLKCASAMGGALIRAGFKPSRHHAEPIAGENRPFADEANGVHFYDDLLVLKTARQPAVLLEAGIIVNRKDELILREPATREKIAKAVAGALASCLGKSAPN